MNESAVPEPASVIAARIKVERCRGDFLETVHVLQARLAPRTLAADAWEKAKVKGADLAEDAVDVVKARPVAVGGVAAAIAMFLVRKPIKEVAGRIFNTVTPQSDDEKRVATLTTSNRRT